MRPRCGRSRHIIVIGDCGQEKHVSPAGESGKQGTGSPALGTPPDCEYPTMKRKTGDLVDHALTARKYRHVRG
jgi:hypothetical protein